MEAVTLRNVSFSYPNTEKKALRDISLSVPAGAFVALCGPSGSGKSTLLRLMKPELAPHGTSEGEIRLFGQAPEEISLRCSAQNIGFLLQDVEYQTVTHTVRSELAFGPENLGLDDRVIRLRIAELAAYFSLESILDKKVADLSGGQKQLVCLASVCAMHPGLLLLDEPTSQLDPAASVTLLEAVNRLCKENGMTVILSEHRLEQVVPMADRLLVLENGKILHDCPPKSLPAAAVKENEFLRRAMPVSMRVFADLGQPGPLPVTVAEGKQKLEALFENIPQTPGGPAPAPARVKTKDPAVEFRHVSFSYDGEQFVLRDCSLQVPRGSFFALMGANAAGKSTALALMCGVLPCRGGKISLLGKNIRQYDPRTLSGGVAALLPQKTQALFGGNTIYEDLYYSLSSAALSKEEKHKKITDAAAFMDVAHLLGTHPYDVSGGELQRAALAMILMKNPQILLLDEPTKGMDNAYKHRLAQRLRSLCDSGVTVVAVTHDTEFAAQYCDEAALLFDGATALQADVTAFFTENYFYTTAANKMARSVLPTAITGAQVTAACRNANKN